MTKPNPFKSPKTLTGDDARIEQSRERFGTTLCALFTKMLATLSFVVDDASERETLVLIRWSQERWSDEQDEWFSVPRHAYIAHDLDHYCSLMSKEVR